jgi:hypothetical protein
LKSFSSPLSVSNLVPKKKGEGYVRDLLAKWNRLHAVRTIVGNAALVEI